MSRAIQRYALYGVLVWLAYAGIATSAGHDPGSRVIRLAIMGVFCLLHAVISLNWRTALVFLVVGLIVPWSFEEIGVLTGLVYGSYHYSPELGMTLGHVPLLVPLAWFMMLYPSYVLANALCTGGAFDENKQWRRLIAFSVVGALLMTAWDLVLDPEISRAGLWVWDEGGSYYGVPLHNFVGWTVTAFTVHLFYRIWIRYCGDHPEAELNTNRKFLIAVLPILAYGGMAFKHMMSGPLGLRLVALFAMGFPALVGTVRLYRHYYRQRASLEDMDIFTPKLDR